MAENHVSISTEHITLDAFLKWAGVAATGGDAKVLIASGAVTVNNDLETRRGRKLRPGDRIVVAGFGRWAISKEGE